MSLLCRYSGVCYSGVCYSGVCYSGVYYCGVSTMDSFINEIKMLQWKRRNIIGRRHDVSGLPAMIKLSVTIFVIVCKVRYQFSSVICLFAPLAVTIFFKLISYYSYNYIVYFEFFFSLSIVVLDGNFPVGRGTGTDYPLHKYISIYARKNRHYNEWGFRTN